MRRRAYLGGAAGLFLTSPLIGRARGAESYRPIGRETIDGAKEVVVDEKATAFVATTDGFATADVSDPADPRMLADRRDLLSDREDGPMESIWDVKIDGDRLLVAGPAAPSNAVSGFLLYDVADPSRPQQLDFFETSFSIHNAFLADGTAYLTAGGSFVIVDVSGEDSRPVGRWELVDADEAWSEVSVGLRAPHDLWVQDGIAYVACWDAGTWIVDVANPESPTALGRVGGRPRDELADLSTGDASSESLKPPGNHHYVQPSEDGSLLAVGKESWASGDGSGGPSGIDLWDVTDPATAEKVSEIRPPRAADETRGGTWTTSHNFDLVDGRLFSSWYQGGVKIHDVSDPSNPEELAWWRDPDQAAFWAAVRVTEDSFVASSTSYQAPNAVEGLLTFPNRPGEQPDPPSLDGTPDGTPESPTATPTPTAGSGSSPTDTRAPDPETSNRTSDPGATDAVSPTETSGQPGFGIPAATTGFGLFAWRAIGSLLRSDEE